MQSGRPFRRPRTRSDASVCNLNPGFTFDFAFPSSSAANNHFRTRLYPPTLIYNPIVFKLDDDDDKLITAPSHQPLQDDHFLHQLLIQNKSRLLLSLPAVQTYFSSAQPTFLTKTTDMFGVQVYVVLILLIKNARTTSSSRRWFTSFIKSKMQSQSHRFRFFLRGYNHRLRKQNSVFVQFYLLDSAVVVGFTTTPST